MSRLPQRTTPVDLDALHLYWWQRTDSRGRLRIEQKSFAARLELTNWHMSRLVGQMEREGRLRPLTATGQARTYIITDPAEWEMSRGRPD